MNFYVPNAYTSNVYIAGIIVVGGLIWKLVDEAAKYFSQDERAAEREHELKVIELKGEIGADEIRKEAQTALQELRQMRAVIEQERKKAQASVTAKPNALSIEAARAAERGSNVRTFKSV